MSKRRLTQAKDRRGEGLIWGKRQTTEYTPGEVREALESFAAGDGGPSNRWGQWLSAFEDRQTDSQSPALLMERAEAVAVEILRALESPHTAGLPATRLAGVGKSHKFKLPADLPEIANDAKRILGVATELYRELHRDPPGPPGKLIHAAYRLGLSMAVIRGRVFERAADIGAARIAVSAAQAEKNRNAAPAEPSQGELLTVLKAVAWSKPNMGKTDLIRLAAKKSGIGINRIRNLLKRHKIEDSAWLPSDEI